MAAAAQHQTGETKANTAVDVAVVGGGPAGLFSALAITKILPDAKVKIYEKASRYHECGAGIFLGIGGMRALRAVNLELYSSIQQTIADPFMDTTGRGPEVEAKAAQQRKGWQRYRELEQTRVGLIGWWELVQMLQGAVPEGMLKLDHSVTSVEMAPDDGGALLSFSGKSPVHAKILIAADGYFSAVRQAVIADGPPEFADVVLWRSRTHWEEGMPLEKDVPGIMKQKTSDRMMSMMYVVPGGKVIWTFSAHVDRMSELGVAYDPGRYTSAQSASQAASVQHQRSADQTAYQRCLQMVSHGFPELLHVVQVTSPDAVIEHGLFTRPAEQVAAMGEQGWGKGMMTMLGDAAHSMRPTGLGLNTALEDAVVLAWHLQRGGLNSESLREFEKERIPRVSTISKQESAQISKNYGLVEKVPMSSDEYESFISSWRPPSLQVA